MAKKSKLVALKRKLQTKQAQLENATERDEELLLKRNKARERANELRQKKDRVEQEGEERIEKLRAKLVSVQRDNSKKNFWAEKRSEAADLRESKIDARFEIIEQKVLDLISDIEEIEEQISALDED